MFKFLKRNKLEKKDIINAMSNVKWMEMAEIARRAIESRTDLKNPAMEVASAYKMIKRMDEKGEISSRNKGDKIEYKLPSPGETVRSWVFEPAIEGPLTTTKD